MVGNNAINIIGKASMGLLLLLVMAMLCPVERGTYAKTAEDPEEATVAQDVSTETRIWVQPVVSVALSSKVDIEVAPKATGSFSQSSANLSVATNSKNGMKVLLSAVGGTALQPTSGTGTTTIETIGQETAAGSFAPNSWGYYIGANEPGKADVFSPLPETNTEVLRTDTSTAQQTYKLTFGAMIDSSLPTGLYQGTVMVSVVVNPIQSVTMQDLYYMQDMRPEICAASKIWESDADSKELIDYRDGKSYQVARLKDGNCWMQELLTLGLSTDMTLTPGDSDVVEVWKPTTTVSGVEYAAGLALAGTQGTATTDGAEYAGSICPKGWKLPLGSTANWDVSGSYYNLIANLYGMTSRPTSDAPLYLEGTYDYVTRTAKSSSEVWTERLYVPSYAGWGSSEPFTDPVVVRCMATGRID